MRKIKKNFIALLMIFTSIVSFLPVGFSGQAAKAASNDEGTDIQVSISGNANLLTPRIDNTTQTPEVIYTTANVVSGFDITVKDVRTTTQDLESQALSSKASTSGIIDQKVDIVSINGTLATDTATLDAIGIKITDYQVVNGAVKSIGKTITNLPLGVNKIGYKVTVTKQNVDYIPAVKDTNGNITQAETYNAKTPVETAYADQSVTIEHATEFVTKKINPMTFKTYVGTQTDFDDMTNTFIGSDSDKENNKDPFLFLQDAHPDKNMALRYIFDVPDSATALKYAMTFDSTMILDNAKIYKNGKEAQMGTEYHISGHTLTGNLTKLGQTDTIVVRLNPSSGSSDIQKAYAIEIRYNQLHAENDYNLSNAGITKLDYDANSGVKAYIGKVFTVTDSNGFKNYTGDIYIDPRAGMISIDPALIRDKSTVAYVVTNNYTDSTNTTRVKHSVLKNGKQFIDFMASTSSNQLQIDVYPGQNGNITDSSTILARYTLTVHEISTNAFSMDLTFGTTGAAATYLTQPGVKENVIDKFTTDRRTYDLYYGSPDVDTVNVNFSGTRSNLNEYVKVWLADDVNSNNLTEAQASANNLPNSSNLRNRSINVKVGTAKKMVVQAYYDEFQYNADGTPKLGSDGNQVYNSYPIGDTYIFYLPENYTSTTPGKGENSSDASLILLKAKDYTLTDSNGKTGFSSSTFDYTTTVNKDDTTVKLTATANDDNVKSITASITGSDQTYTLGSGQEEELPLNSSGTTIVKVVVTAQDGSTTKTYSIVITNNTKSSNVNLKNVILSTGDFTFDPTADVTKVRVDPNITSIKVTPVPEDSKSKVSVNGDDYSNTAIDVSLKGIQKTEISIEVTSEDGKLSKTYTLEIYRVDSASWDNDSNNNNNSSDTDDQYYDEYNDTWVDLSKYDEWGTVNGKPAYFDKHNRQVKNAWISTNGKYYYLNNLGYRASGWKVDSTDGKSYYLDPTTGEMKTGWINLNNTWYYLDLNGVMHKGWLSLNKKWYYFTPNGQMVINQIMYIDDKLCTFGQDGALIA